MGIKKDLSQEQLKDVLGGIANPVSGVSSKDAIKEAKRLGSKRKNMGTWEMQNASDYIKWWINSNPDEYEKHKNEVDDALKAIMETK